MKMGPHAHDFVDAPSGAITGLTCDLCGETLKPFEISQAVRDVSALDICTCCLEGMLDATAINPRSEVGLVGSCGGRS